LKFSVTIDVEEDNWNRYSRTENPVHNVKRLLTLQELFDRYGVRPTYLVDYPVVTDPVAVGILKEFLEHDKCEIGMHCHPWNTPPFTEELSDFNSMLSNLPEVLVSKKLTVLHAAIMENLQVKPVSFRAGRWGFSRSVAMALKELGYRIDTSVSPYVDWSDEHGPDYSQFQLLPYRFDPVNIASPRESGVLFEVPTTVGFLQGDFARCQKWTQQLKNAVGRKLRLQGIFARLGLLNKVWLSPELSDAKSMLKLMQRLEARSVPVLNMSFHSTSLMAGLTPFVLTVADEISFLERIEAVLAFALEAEYKFLTLAEYEAQCTGSAPNAGQVKVMAKPAPCLGLS